MTSHPVWFPVFTAALPSRVRLVGPGFFPQYLRPLPMPGDRGIPRARSNSRRLRPTGNLTQWDSRHIGSQHLTGRDPAHAHFGKPGTLGATPIPGHSPAFRHRYHAGNSVNLVGPVPGTSFRYLYRGHLSAHYSTKQPVWAGKMEQFLWNSPYGRHLFFYQGYYILFTRWYTRWKGHENALASRLIF